MNVIISNLKDPSWWFTGVFFIIVGLLLTAIMTRWLPRWYRRAATHVPLLFAQFDRKRRLKMLKRIRSRRFHPLLVIREISRTDAIMIMVSVMGVLVVVAYSTFPKEEVGILKSMSRILIFIPLYAVQIMAVQRIKFLGELLKACKRVGTTRCCTVSANSRRGCAEQ